MTTIRGTASGTGWTIAHNALLRAATRAYADHLATMRPPRGQCFEFATIAADIARTMRIAATPCIGTWRSPIGPVIHAWLAVGDFVLHSPLPGEVEVAPRSDAFVARTRRGYLNTWASSERRPPDG